MKKRNKKSNLKKVSSRAGTHARQRRDLRRAGGERIGRMSAEGLFSGTRRGFGFVTVEGLSSDVFIPAGRCAGALDGDRVRIEYRCIRPDYAEGSDRYEGVVLSVLDAARRTVIGTYLEASRYTGGYYGRRGGAYLVIPDDTRLPEEIRVRPSLEAKSGDKVEIAIRGRTDLSGEVVRVFGPASSREANYDAILASAGIIREFEPDALLEAERMAARPLSCEGRKRYPHEMIFTIDGAGAKDLDDAISLRRLPQGKWLLGVHIADVSEYVLQKTPLDRAAMERGTSVYFVDQVVPMLPPALSNGACSLHPGEEKYTLSAWITISPEGELMGLRLERGIIESRVRGVYSEVNDLFEKGKESPFFAKYRAVYPSLERMHELYEILLARSRARGALSFDRPDAVILLDESGHPRDIAKCERGDAERMIEQFMLAANEAVAAALHARSLPCVYRIHEDPMPERVLAFADYARSLGLDTACLRGRAVSPRDLASVMKEAEGRSLSETISYPMLRALAKARYSEKASRHFGLGIDLYCHFTSPIRRLSDLATHRIIKATLLGGAPAMKYLGYAKRAASAASEGELRALDAERRIEAMYKALYLADRIGEEFVGRVSSVTGFGMFVELENTCEGLVPLASLPGGTFFHDEKMMALVSGHTSFRPGDALRIRVEEVEAMQGRVTFSFLERVTEEN